jgi:hypothetical protein
MFSLTEETQKKWAPILEHEDLAPIKDAHRRSVTAQILENTERALRDDAAHGQSSSLLSEQPISTNNWGNSSANGGTGGNINAFDPILISLVRRSMPNLMAYDIAGVQPMSGPTGLIFAMRSRYTNQTGAETFYNEVNTAFSSVTSGANTVGQKHVGTLPTGVVNTYNTGSTMGTAQLEALGTDANAAFAEMAFSIEKVTVTAGGRALKAEYSMELAQDLKAVHGLDAETELSNILSTEILAEINREVVRTVNIIAKPGAQVDTATAGVFDLDTDSNGRWSVEKFKGLMFQLEREANQIAKDTRRGKGNIVICSADVASALQMAGVLDYTPALDRNNNMTIDDTGNTFAGVLNGRLKVYIDPYAIGGNYLTVGFKGTNPFDAGLFYCPYVPLQMVKAIDPQSFQPKIGFKTRYGMVANPYAEGLTKGLGALNANANVYYRRIAVANLM